MNKDIIFLLRSHNRPEYLKQTLEYLEYSDINAFCDSKYIYDDASDNQDTLNILNKYKEKYKILFHTKNYKQKSFVKFIEYIESINTEHINFICYLDNDALVTDNFIKSCVDTFELIKKEQNKKNTEIILTGFNTQSHKIITSYDKYVLKNSIGGIHLFFHKSLLSNLKKWWDLDEDWGVTWEFKKQGGELYATKPSVIEHIGKIGHNSHLDCFDKSEITVPRK